MRTTELQTLRQELQMYRFYVRDEEMRELIKEWISEAKHKDAGTVQEFIRRKLSEMRTEYPMRWAPHLQQGSDGFPDECQGCPHYGSACPIVTDREQRIARERRLSETDTEAEARAVWEDIAVDTGCKRIHEWISEWDESHRGFVDRGHQLLEEVEDLTLDAESDMEQLPEELREMEGRDDVLAFGGADDD